MCTKVSCEWHPCAGHGRMDHGEELCSLLGLLIRSRHQAELLEYLTWDDLLVLNHHSAQQRWEMAAPCSKGGLLVPFYIVSVSLITSSVGLVWSPFVLCSTFQHFCCSSNTSSPKAAGSWCSHTMLHLKEGSRARQVISSFCMAWLCLEMGRTNGRL